MAANETLDVLNNLIETCRDGQEGYREAAQHTQSADLKDFFNHKSLERAQFAGELEAEAERLGESDPDRGPSLANKLYRAWIDLTQKMGAGNASILEFVESGEDHAKKRYEKALRSSLPSDVRAIVETQAQAVFAAHDRIRTLRDTYKKAA